MARAASIALVVGLAACGYPRPADVGEPQRVGGRLHGLWDGADGATLRLQADGVDTLLTVAASGRFEFPPLLPPGASYTVTVAASPARHSCAVAGGGNGSVTDDAPPDVAVACTGPVGAVTLSGPWAWRFDPTEEAQVFDGSVAAQEVALTITGGELTAARVADQPVAIGAPTPRLALGLGSTEVAVALTAGALSKTYQLEFRRGAALLDQVVYGKPSNTAEDLQFAAALALDGDTLAIGAGGEASKAKGVDGDQTDRSAPNAGAVYVFVRRGGAWIQQAYLKASNTGSEDGFGRAVALSGDTLAVGASGEASSAPGIDGDQGNNSMQSAGAVYVFVRTGERWQQQAYVKASNPDLGDVFGYRVALSGDTLAVGAYNEASSATGVNPPGGQASNAAPGAGAVYVFTRQGAAWSQQAYVKPSNAGGYFGTSLALSGDTLAVGAPNEASAATGINGDQADHSAVAAGAVYVFVRTGAAWSQQAYIKASNTGMFDGFGYSVALAGDTLAVGAPDESSAAAGVDPPGGQADDRAPGAGAVYLFARQSATWTQQAYVKASNPDPGDAFGFAVALAGDTLVVGAQGESSIATGVDADQSDNSALVSGAAYAFARDAAGWHQRGYIKASNAGAHDQLGAAVAASHDAIAVGAWREASRATGVNPPDGPADNSTRSAGAVYVFR